MVHFVGAGSGAADLITLRGARLLEKAGVIIYAGSLVNPELLQLAGPSCEIHNSASMTLQQVILTIESAEKRGLETVRLHTGDPCLFGAINEQIKALEALKIPYDITPGVSSFCGAAAALKTEYTLPGVSQSVIITRVQGKTEVPKRESIALLAAHNATMVVFLSAALTEKLQDELLSGGYPPQTQAAIVYKATWPQERVLRCTVENLHKTAVEGGITSTALIVVGDVLKNEGEPSKLYDAAFSTAFRKAEQA